MLSCVVLSCVVLSGVLPVERPADIESGEFNKQASLVYTFGHTSPAPNFKLYSTLVSSMAGMFQERCKVKPKSKSQSITNY